MMAGGFWAFSGPVQAATFTQLTPGSSVLAGTNRYQVALSVAKSAFPNATTAILASGATANEWDPLLASPLSAQLKAPILLTQSASSIGSITLAGLSALKISSVILVGATATEASALKAQLPKNITVSATYGNAIPSDTAASLAAALEKMQGLKSLGSVFAVSNAPANLADVVSAAPAAAMSRSPMLLVPPSSNGVLPSSEAPYLNTAATVYAVGAASSFGFTSTSANTQIVPLTGASRSQTLLAVDTRFFPNATSVFIANGETNHLVDALAVGPLIAEQGGALLFMYGPNRFTPSGTQAFLANTSQVSTINTLTFVGGPTSIPTLDYTMFEQDFSALGSGVKTMTLTPSTTAPTTNSIISLSSVATSVAGKPISLPVTWSVTGSNSSDAVIESTGANTAAFVAVKPGTYTISASVDGTTQTLSLTLSSATTSSTS
jgi:3D (Asp-Asp-Asp) domain-containing protein